MILQALTSYYEALAARGKIARPGWSPAKISYALEIDENGKLLDIHSLDITAELPKRERNSSDITACFLGDDRRYVLGIPDDSSPKEIKNAKKRFEASRLKYHKILAGDNLMETKAVLSFFDTWDVQKTKWPDLVDTIQPKAIIVFLIDDKYFHLLPSVKKAWDDYYAVVNSTHMQRCMITENLENTCRIHPGFNIPEGTNPKLVSFDKDSDSFCSYGKDGQQGLNVPVGYITAAKYGSALDYLLSSKNNSTRIGSTMLVFWAENTDSNEDKMLMSVVDDSNTIDDNDLKKITEIIRAGQRVPETLSEDKFDNDYYIIGLYSATKGSIGVRLFYKNTFNSIIANLGCHYNRLKINNSYQPEKYNNTLISMLLETVKKDDSKKKLENIKALDDKLVFETLIAILSDSDYPQLLLTQILTRIKNERNVVKKDLKTGKKKENTRITAGRAAIIKAVLIKNYGMSYITEVLMETDKDKAYLLGRLFYFYEETQYYASKGTINATINDTYFNAACCTPCAVSPKLTQLNHAHMKVVRRDNIKRAYFLENQIGKIISNLGRPPFPSFFDEKDQGLFILGYYQQRQKSIDSALKYKTMEENTNDL